MPIVESSSYKAPFGRSNPHLQTIVPTLYRKIDGVQYQRERFTTSDQDFLDLDWSRVGARRLVIVLHGLEGSSERPYMKGMVKAFNKHNWDALAMNFRGCSGESNLNTRMYHSGETEDLGAVIAKIIDAGTYDRLALVGFSLGGNVILKYLGERGTNIPAEIKGAAVFSVPCDLEACSVCLERWSNRLYLYRFLGMLGSKVKAKSLAMSQEFDEKAFDELKMLRDFDDKFTAPLHGFKDATDYYTKSSCKQFLAGISVPTLLVNAADDPFMSETCYPTKEAEENPNLFLEIPKHGGHVGFMASASEGQYWSETRATEFLNKIVGR